MRVLALDIGEQRTGVAIFESDIGFVRPLSTLKGDDAAALVERIDTLARERRVDRLVLGLPLLPSGREGRQALFVHTIADDLRRRKWDVEWIDERYTTPQHPLFDGDAESACEILKIALIQKGIDI